MRTTGQFEIHYYPVNFKKFGESIPLIPFGDIHRSASLCHVEKWHEFLDWAKQQKNALFLGMGDYDDLVSTSERESLSRANLHDQTFIEIESMYKRHTDRLIKELSFMKGRIIGLMEGNHYASFLNGTTSTQRMCDALGAKYLGCSAFVRLSFLSPTAPKLNLSLDVWAHHGMGASRLVGGSFNRVQQMAETAEADLYIMGHDHKRGALPVNRLRLQGNGEHMHLVNRKIYLVRSGSFLRGYVPGERSYVADGAMSPCDLGCVPIMLTPQRVQKDREHSLFVDIKAIV